MKKPKESSRALFDLKGHGEINNVHFSCQKKVAVLSSIFRNSVEIISMNHQKYDYFWLKSVNDVVGLKCKPSLWLHNRPGLWPEDKDTFAIIS